MRHTMLILLTLGSGLLTIPPCAVAQVSGPLQVGIVGDTLADEGDRVSFSIFPWMGGAEVVSSRYRWDFGDGTAPVEREEETAVGHRFMQDGEYAVVASDGNGVTQLRVRVRAKPPIVELLSHDGPRLFGETIKFQALARDPGADTLIYTWDFGDGSRPRSGPDLTELTQVYREPGSYEVTLIVADEDGLEARRTVRVTVNPGFFGRLSGDVELPVEGVSGKATLMNPNPFSRALGGIPVFTGAAPIITGVVDLSESLGLCMVTAGFWDDEHKVHVNFTWTATSDSIWIPETYPVSGPRPDFLQHSGQAMVNTLVLGIEPSYEDTKRGAENMQPFEGGVVRSLLSSVGGLLSGMRRQQPVVSNPGRNWLLASPGGNVTVTKVTPRYISGYMTVELMGAWMSWNPEANGQADSQTLQGAFLWELDEASRANLRLCGDRTFVIESHEPEVEAEAVDYERPGVSVTFSLPMDRSSVSTETLELGYLDTSDGFNRIDARIVFDEDPRTVRLVPNAPLDDAVYHMVRVLGGEEGIKSIGGDPLSDDHEWRFSTMPELVARPESTP